MHLFSAGLLAAFLFAPVAFAQSPVSDAERRMIEDLSLEDYTVGYKDAEGNRIDFETFNKQVLAGREFGHFKNTGTHVATLVLLADGMEHPAHPQSGAPNGSGIVTFETPMPGAQPGLFRVDESSSDSLNAQLGLEGYTVSYANADGGTIDFAAFSAGMGEGREFSITKNSNNKTAVLALGGMHDTLAPARATGTETQAGMTLPDFSLRTLDGRTVDKATLLGRATLLSFHFAECLPCIREIPMLNAFAQANPGMHLFSVTFDDRETSVAFRDRHGLDWSILPDAQTFIDGIGIKTYPSMVLVDGSGTIRASESGVDRLTSAAQLQAWVDDALSTPAVR